MISNNVMRPIKILVSLGWGYICLCKVLPFIVYRAYDIRLSSIKEYGPVIHEFDPYFNFRATEYLYHHGWSRFVTWFDYKSWYPLGRPVGTTIYPGMQVTAVFIKNHVLPKMSLNDICVYIPAWFGSIASVMTGLLAYECSLPLSGDEPFGSILENVPLVSWIYTNIILKIFSFVLKGITYVFGTDLGLSTASALPDISKSKSKIIDVSSPAVEIGLIAAAIMAIVPAHMMRSVGGGYDNESIANTAMTMTFYLWCRTLRGGVNYDSWKTFGWAILTALSYFYMVAVWGGYVFVINLIGVHAAILVLLGRFGIKLYKAYSVFYFLGTFLATRVPVVGTTPLKSLEQLGPGLVFLGFQLLAFCEQQRKKKKMNRMEAWKFRIVVFAVAAIAGAVIAYLLDQYLGYFGPISSRVRGLFVKHTKTGNPLVDSVAEHQPASSQAYKQYLGESIVQIAPFGVVLVAFRYFHDSSSFLLVYGITTYFFSHKMVRLILLTAPIASVFAAVFLGRLWSFFLYNAIGFSPSLFDIFSLTQKEEGTSKDNKKVEDAKEKPKKKKNAKEMNGTQQQKPPERQSFAMARSVIIKVISVYAATSFYMNKIYGPANSFIEMSETISVQMSNPTIIMKARLRSGETVKVDDYRECYWWIRDNTPEDSRIMAWWDYGYQITAIANRTTIADGNTWNHEHIALLGRALTSSEREGHRIARHLADYVFVWAGGGGDDLAKSPHLARIANSVYRSMCPGDPTCSQFGYTQSGPSKMMAESLLFKLVGHGVKPNVFSDPNRFKHKFTSKYGKCRVFKIQSVSKESKEWVANPKNRDCDAPGSWFCRGQYPPGMQKILAEKRDFSQLEDFNKDVDDSEYQKKYFENLNKKRPNAETRRTSESRKSPSSGQKKTSWKPDHEVSPEVIATLNSKWENNAQTSTLWEMISNNKIREFMDVIAAAPELGHIRSEDGRGPMWWAVEANNDIVIKVLKRVGVKDTYRDKDGLTPADLRKKDEL